MGKATRAKRAFKFDAEAPPAAQLANGSFERDFITHAETNTKAMAYRRESTILEQWCKNGGLGFDEGAKRAIADCQVFWARMGEPVQARSVKPGEGNGLFLADLQKESDGAHGIIPSPGFRMVSGKRAPPAGKWWVQFRNGQIDHLGPWPSKGPRWVHDGSEWDIVAVKPEHEKRKDGRQADGSYE